MLPADAVEFPGSAPPPGTERAVIRVDVRADRRLLRLRRAGHGRTSATRPQYPAWAETKVRKGGERALDEYVAEKNARSIDGLPAIDVGDLEPA